MSALVATAVKKQDFKTCEQSSFCKRNRAYADKSTENPSYISPYSVIQDSIIIKDGIIFGDLINSENNIKFVFELYLLEIGATRIKINEKRPLKPRYDRVKDWALVQELSNTLEYSLNPSKPGFTSLSFGKERNQTVLIYHSPFRVEFLVNDVPTIILNDRGLLNIEHLRKKDEDVPSPVDQSNSEDNNIVKEENDIDKGLWKETFNGKEDPKPN
ncbi:9252_t:CDS:1, partial [Scutellospora calospora]